MRSIFTFGAALLLAWPIAQAAVTMRGSLDEHTTKVTTLQIPISTVVEANVVEVTPGKQSVGAVAVASKTPKMMETMPAVMETAHDPCDMECTKMDFNPICAANGHCRHEFPNECIMLGYNCRHPTMSFTMITAEPCSDDSVRKMPLQSQSHHHHQHSWLKRCTPEDLVGGLHT